MKLKFNSPIAKLYRWYYIKEEMPESLCPYFWKLVLMWVLIVPYIIFSLPMIIFKKSDSVDSCIDRCTSGVLLWVFIFFTLDAIFSISVFWHLYPDGTLLGVLQTLGLVFLVVYIVVIIACFIFYIIEKHDYSYKKPPVKTKKEKRPSIIVEFIKAKYNKYCPRIEWDKPNQNN